MCHVHPLTNNCVIICLNLSMWNGLRVKAFLGHINYSYLSHIAFFKAAISWFSAFFLLALLKKTLSNLETHPERESRRTLWFEIGLD